MPNPRMYSKTYEGLQLVGDQPIEAPALMLPDTYLRANMDRVDLTNITPLSTGRMTLALVYLKKGEVVTNLTFCSGTTALATGTALWFALYDINLSLLRQTANQSSPTWAASALKTLALASTYKATYTGWYYAAVMVAATTVPSLSGAAGVAAINTLPPVVTGSSTTGLTTTAPATAAALTVSASTPYVLVG